MAATLGVFYGILLIVIGIVQIGVGFMGIEYHLGALWPWYGALALTAPGLIFILPAMISSALGTLFNR